MRVRNVITTANLNQRIDAQRFTSYPWGRYDQETYGGRCGYIKDKEMAGRVTVFFSGKMISTGSTSVGDSIAQLERAKNILVRHEFACEVKLTPHVQNVVATADIGSRINLGVLSTVVDKLIYEPEQFPGAILRTALGPTCLIFASGKVVMVGAKSEQQLLNTELFLLESLQTFHLSPLSMTK